MRKIVICLIVILIFIVSCDKANKNQTQKPVAICTTSKQDSVIINQKLSTPEVEYLSDLNFQKDTIFFPSNKNRAKKMFFVDIPIKNGFTREYYCGNKVINNLIVENNKIVSGIYVNAASKANVVKRIWELYEYENGKRDGVYVSIFCLRPVSYGIYHKGVKTELMGKYTSCTRPGMFYRKILKNGKLIESSYNYKGWEKEESIFLNRKEAESIKIFIHSLYNDIGK